MYFLKKYHYNLTQLQIVLFVYKVWGDKKGFIDFLNTYPQICIYTLTFYTLIYDIHENISKTF